MEVSHFQQYFSYIAAVSVIGGGNLAWVRFELTTLVMIDTDCIGSYNSN